ncbi:uncharacterized protein EV420DRAFT_203338 [Desarmillaria tabescens]|uniref:Uncharacterized protein n=1 Tax=Armillaria tabescens TaxID=1929756 RepID=A0AA39J6U0_ARMTA|nr:uncharacterized protein EV420DRAFT_203338 [Desarmillaria tabescens]KAK0437123.1 hypothetical protein EV420DRAFT_203338 [Desarmillaria tabescens]
MSVVIVFVLGKAWHAENHLYWCYTYPKTMMNVRAPARPMYLTPTTTLTASQDEGTEEESINGADLQRDAGSDEAAGQANVCRVM